MWSWTFPFVPPYSTGRTSAPTASIRVLQSSCFGWTFILSFIFSAKKIWEMSLALYNLPHSNTELKTPRKLSRGEICVQISYPPANGASLGSVLFEQLLNRQTDKFFDTIYGGYVDFFLQLNLLPPYSLRSKGDKFYVSSYLKIEKMLCCHFWLFKFETILRIYTFDSLFPVSSNSAYKAIL